MEHNLIHRTVDSITGEIIEKPLNENELLEIKEGLEENAKIVAKLSAKKEVRLEILNRLGITEEEAKLLLS